VAQKIDSNILPGTPLIFAGVTKSKIWPRFSIKIAFDTFWFRKGATYQKWQKSKTFT